MAKSLSSSIWICDLSGNMSQWAYNTLLHTDYATVSIQHFTTHWLCHSEQTTLYCTLIMPQWADNTLLHTDYDTVSRQHFTTHWLCHSEQTTLYYTLIMSQWADNTLLHTDYVTMSRQHLRMLTTNVTWYTSRAYVFAARYVPGPVSTFKCGTNHGIW